MAKSTPNRYGVKPSTRTTLIIFVLHCHLCVSEFLWYMDKKHLFRFCAMLFLRKHSFAWSHKMEVVLQRMESQESTEVLADAEERSSVAKEDKFIMQSMLSKTDAQERDSVHAYMLTSFDDSCQFIVCRMWSPCEVQDLLQNMFRTVADAKVDANLSHFQALFKTREKNQSSIGTDYSRQSVSTNALSTRRLSGEETCPAEEPACNLRGYGGGHYKFSIQLRSRRSEGDCGRSAHSRR